MNSTRKAAVIAGVLFIIATVAGLSGTALAAIPTGADYLTQLSAQASQVAAGALLHLIGYAACVGIAVALYPVLIRWNAGLALGSVLFRTLEAAFYMVGLACVLSLLTLAQQFTSAVAADRAALQAVGDALQSVHNRAALLGVLIEASASGKVEEDERL